MNTKRLLIYIICVIAMVTGAKAQSSSLMQQADSAYSHEDYREAVRLYTRAIDTDGVSAELYYNLGNAYYRIDNPGRAILCYQRALNIDPSYPDARENLNFVKSRIVNRPEDDSSFLGNMHESIAALMSANAWAWVTLACFALLLVCAGMYIFTDEVKLRKAGFFGGLILVFVTIYFSTISYSTAKAYSASGKAVVTVPTANLFSAPGVSTKDNNRVIPISEGTVVEITDSTTIPGETSSPKWYNVKINNSTKAWINSADIEII